MKTLRFLFLVVFCTALTSYSQTTEWAKQFGGTIDAQSSGVAIDVNGDVIITGYFRGTTDFNPGAGVFNLSSNSASDDIFITKLDSDGNLIWAKAIGSAADDRGNSVATDNLGNIYVTGTFRNTADFDPGAGVFNLTSNGSEDAFVLVLDSDGNFLWASQIGSASNDNGIAIAVDSNNQVWVTGSFLSSVTIGVFNLNSAGQEDIFVCKYDQNGTVLWAGSFGGTLRNVPGSIAVDNTDKVIISGSFQGTMLIGSTNLISAGADDIFAFKLNSGGVPEWAVRIGGTGVDSNFSVKTFGSNIFIAGSYSATANFGPVANPWSSISNGGTDALLIKLTATGAFVWGTGFGGAGNDAANAVACNSTGDIHLTGTFEQTVDFYPGITQYKLSSAGLNDTYIQKLNNNGEFIWTKTLNGTTSNKGLSIATDTEGNVYTAGNFVGTWAITSGAGSVSITTIGQQDAFIHKMSNCSDNSVTIQNIESCHFYYSPSGNYQYVESGTYADILLRNSGCDSLIVMNVNLLEGPVVNTNRFSCGSYTSPSGNTTWTASGSYQDLVPAASGCDTLYNVNLYVQSATGCSSKSMDWYNQLGATGWDRGMSIAVDNQGNSYICGYFPQTFSFEINNSTETFNSAGGNDIFIAKLGSNGKAIWVKQIGGTGDDQATSLAIDSQNNLLITGSFGATVDFDPGPAPFNLSSTGSIISTFVLKLDENGDFLWAKSFTGSGNAYGNGIALDVFGDVLVAGSFFGTVDFNPSIGVNNHSSVNSTTAYFYIVKLDQGGNYVWSLARGGTANNHSNAYAITTDQDGNIITTGNFAGTVSFSAPGNNLSSVSGSVDVYVYKINLNGEFIWVKRIAGTSFETGRAITTDNNGSVIVAGQFSGTVDFDPGTGTSTIAAGTIYRGFVLKLTAAGNYLWAMAQGGTTVDAFSYAVVTDASNSIYVGGKSNSGSSLNGVGVTTYSSSGNLLNSYVRHGGGEVRGLAIDYTGGLYLIGHFSGSLPLIATPIPFSIQSLNSYDVIVLKLSDCNNSNYYFQTVEACESFNPPGSPPSFAWFTSGVYSYDVTNSFGCTDYNVYDVTINNGPTKTYNITSCNSYVSAVENNTYYESTTYIETVPNPLGCDSILTINLEITGTNIDQFHLECNSYTNQSNETYTSSGVYDEYIPTSSGCDTLIRHHLIVHNSNTTSCDAHETTWIKQQGGSQSGEARAVATDQLGNIYSTGSFRGQIDFDPGPNVLHLNIGNTTQYEVFISKMDAAGNLVWAKKFTGSNSTSNAYGKAIIVDAEQNVYVTGIFRGTVNFDTGGGTTNLTSAGNDDVFICKLNASGALVWARRIGNASNIDANSIALDSFNRVFITGSFSGTVDFNPEAGVLNRTSSGSTDVYILRLTNPGGFSSAYTFGGSGADVGLGISIDASGNMLTTGSFSGTANFNPAAGTTNLVSAGSTDIFVSKISAIGGLQWAYRAGGTGSDVGRTITTDALGNIFVAGTFSGTATFGSAQQLISEGNLDVCIFKLNSIGQIQWSKGFGGTGNDYCYAIDFDLAGNLIYTGTFQNTVDFNPGATILQTYYLTSLSTTSNNPRDFYVASLNPEGIFRFAKSFGGPEGKDAYAIAGDLNNDIIVAGSFNGTVNFNSSVGTYSFTAPTGSTLFDIFTLKLKSCLFATSSEIFVTECDAYVSPSGNYTWMESGVYNDVIMNSAGCDSLITVNLSINGSSTIYNEAACESYFWPENGINYSASGTYSVAYQNQLGCDSTIVLNLTINENEFSNLQVNACDSYSSPSQQYVWTESGTYMDTISTVAGCDSIMTINLTISSDTESFIEATECVAYISPSGNLTLTTSGIYTDVIPNVAGCDSTITIDLTILGSFSFSETLTSCGSYLWDVNGLNYSNSGTYTANFTSVDGCDSTYVLNLTIPVINTNVNQNGANLSAVLSGATYQWIDCSDNTPIVGATSQFFTATQNGSYAVQITISGCPALSNCFNVTTIDVENYSFMQQISVYPNPTADNVFINVADLNESLSVRMMNVVGQIISSGEYTKSNIIEYQMPVTPGVYFLELITESGNHALVKIVKL